MALSDYKPEQREFKLKGGTFSVKGLSLTEFATLIHYHLPDLEAIFELGKEAVNGKTEFTESDLGRLAIMFAEQAPGFAANVIALASGEDQEAAVNAARTLPFPVTVEVLTSVAKLTFDEVGGVKKAMELVTGLLSKMKVPEKMPALRVAT